MSLISRSMKEDVEQEIANEKAEQSYRDMVAADDLEQMEAQLLATQKALFELLDYAKRMAWSCGGADALDDDAFEAAAKMLNHTQWEHEI